MYPQTLKIRTNSLQVVILQKEDKHSLLVYGKMKTAAVLLVMVCGVIPTREQIIRQMHMTEPFTDILRNKRISVRVDTISILV